MQQVGVLSRLQGTQKALAWTIIKSAKRCPDLLALGVVLDERADILPVDGIIQ